MLDVTLLFSCQTFRVQRAYELGGRVVESWGADVCYTESEELDMLTRERGWAFAVLARAQVGESGGFRALRCCGGGTGDVKSQHLIQSIVVWCSKIERGGRKMGYTVATYSSFGTT